MGKRVTYCSSGKLGSGSTRWNSLGLQQALVAPNGFAGSVIMLAQRVDERRPLLGSDQVGSKCVPAEPVTNQKELVAITVFIPP